MLENEYIEFKQDYTEKIYKEIVAFLNTCNGTIYVGYDDNGNLVGLKDYKKVEELISNEIINKISPDCRMFVRINNKTLNDKNYIAIDVLKGLDIYYLKEKGLLNGVYIRNGSCSVKASEEVVKQIIINNSNSSFETSISSNQELTFNYAKQVFSEFNINIEDNNIMKNLKLINDNGMYTNLALLLSEQNPYAIKIAVYENKEKANFLDRKEFLGSIFEIYDKTIDYLKINSQTLGIINNSIREDTYEYPEFILREIVLNSLIHRDYLNLASNIINIYKNSGIEFINYGSLYGNITLDDILAGLSTSRNPLLQSIFMRVKRVEAIGSGLRRINSFYKNLNLEISINVLPASFIITIPSIIYNNIDNSNKEEDLILNYLNKNEEITRSNAEKIINKEKTTTSNILSGMVNANVLKKIGNGPNTKYVLFRK